MKGKDRSLALTVAGLRRLGGDGDATLAQAADRLAERSALLPLLPLAVLGMVPSPGIPLGLMCGLLVMWLSLAHLTGRRHGSLPSILGGRRLPQPVMDAALRRLVPLLRRIERRSAARLTVLASGGGAVLATLALAGQGMMLALPIPFGNVPPGLAILALSAGLIWRDGIAILVGYGLSIASFAILGGLLWGGGLTLSHFLT